MTVMSASTGASKILGVAQIPKFKMFPASIMFDSQLL